MPSLNQLASSVAHDIGQPYNFVLLKRIKDMFIQNRSFLLRRSIEKRGVEDQYIQKYVVELQDIDSGDNCEVSIGCTIKRTVNKIATPLRYQSDSPFLSIGSPDGEVIFTYASGINEIISARNVMNVNLLPRYRYINNYIYLYNFDGDTLAATAIYEDPTLVYPITSDSCTGSGICYDDDMEFPCPLDIVSEIKSIIYKALGIIKEQPESEVKTDAGSNR